MILVDRTIKTFKNRLAELTLITSINLLPQWTDVDIITADCVLTEYYKLRKKSQQQDLAINELRNRLKHAPGETRKKDDQYYIDKRKRGVGIG